MKIHLKCLLTVIVIVLALGLGGPWLISARDNMAVVLGFLMMTTLFPGALYLIWSREIATLTKPPKEAATA